jgi:uroporphyrinogen III methyltransferase/synthase
LALLLRQAGAQPLFYPCIAIVPPEDTAELDQALGVVDTFDWLILTSANTVHVLASRINALNLPRALLANVRVAAVGPATAEAARELLGVEAVVPADMRDGVGAQRVSHLTMRASLRNQSTSDTFNAQSLATTLPLERGARLLLPQSEIASAELAQALVSRGADVQTVTAYRTVCGSGGDPVPRLLAHGQVDAVTFTSSSTVGHFLARFSSERGSRGDLEGVTIACIGGSTARAAQDAGLNVAVVPPLSTMPALVDSLEEFFNA